MAGDSCSAETGGVRVVNDAGAGLHAAVEVLLPEGRFKFGPVNEVRADGVNQHLFQRCANR